MLLFIHFVHTIARLSLYEIAFLFSTGDRNFCDLVVRVDTAYSTGTFVECAFFQKEYTCTIDYGTDPSYTNLDYSNTSSTLGRIANITLSQEIRGDTTYYYIVSAESNSLCVRVRGSFRAGRYRNFGVLHRRRNEIWKITSSGGSRILKRGGGFQYVPVGCLLGGLGACCPAPQEIFGFLTF